MIFKPKYSYEYNCILNENFNEHEQIKNYASLLTDKDRFFLLLQDINNKQTIKLIEKHSGIKLPQQITFYIVRAEKFNSFSEPITIEYKINPEEMIINLIKETIKTNFEIRFPDEDTRNNYIKQFTHFIFTQTKNKNYLKFIKKTKNKKTLNFQKKTLKDLVYELYE